jgi:hypothetical protein
VERGRVSPRRLIESAARKIALFTRRIVIARSQRVRPLAGPMTGSATKQPMPPQAQNSSREKLVMPGLDPGIHRPSREFSFSWMDGRVKPGHDDETSGQLDPWGPARPIHHAGASALAQSSIEGYFTDFSALCSLRLAVRTRPSQG